MRDDSPQKEAFTNLLKSLNDKTDSRTVEQDLLKRGSQGSNHNA